MDYRDQGNKKTSFISYQFAFKEGQERPPCKGGCPEGAGGC